MKLLKIAILLIIFINPAYAANDNRKITVTGESQVTLEAQYSIIHSELKYVSTEMAKSYTQLHQTLSTVIENLKEIGLTDKEITKSIVRQGSEYSWNNNSREHTGYYSSSTMKLRVNNLENLPLIYNELSKHDTITIHWTEYGINDETENRNIELNKALLIAKEKAVSMAKCLGAKVGPVLHIEEVPTKNIVQRAQYESRAGSNRSGGTFGSVDIIVRVLVEFELE